MSSKKSVVSVVKLGTSYDQAEVAEAVRKAVDLAGGISHLFSPGDLVLLKPNVVAVTEYRNGAVTSPELCRAVYDLVADLGGRPVIAESSAVGVDTEEAFVAAGYDQLRQMGYEIVDLKKRPAVTLPVPNNWVMPEISTWDIVEQAKLIVSLPAMKTHDQCEVTLSLKNIKGLVADKHKKKMHKLGVNRGVSDINALFRPGFAIVDGITAQEGLGPMYGRPVPLGLITASADMVALDAVTGLIMGFDPQEVQVTMLAAERGLGTMSMNEIDVAGEDIDAVKRRFMRVLEDCPIPMDDFSIIYGDDPCTGCRLGLMSCLMDMRKAGQFEFLKGMTLVLGNADIPQELAEDSIVTIGACVPKNKRRGRFVEGCPPNSVWVVQGIIGDRGTASRTYATGPAEEEEENER